MFPHQVEEGRMGLMTPVRLVLLGGIRGELVEIVPNPNQRAGF